MSYEQQKRSGAWAYTTLSEYNQGYYGKGNIAPVPVDSPSVSTIVVPSWGGPGYDTLFHCSGSDDAGNGYYSLNNAYPSFPDNCGRFTNRLCSGK